jgi:hypothetical protein
VERVRPIEEGVPGFIVELVPENLDQAVLKLSLAARARRQCLHVRSERRDLLALVTDCGAGPVVPARVHLTAPGLALEVGRGDLRLDGVDVGAQLIDRAAARRAGRRQLDLAGVSMPTELSSEAPK